MFRRFFSARTLSIDSIRYPAVSYKPLARIDRCFRCQQFGHKAIHCSNESKCYKSGENHEYNRECTNVVKRANCNAQHMAGSSECLVKIAYRREKRQQQEERRGTNQQQSSSYLSSPARLYSSVLQTMAPHVHAETKDTHDDSRSSDQGQSDQSSIILNALKEEIGRSQEVLLNRITQLEEKCDVVREQLRRIEMDDWYSDRSLHVDNVRVARWRMPAIGYDKSHRIDRSAANENSSTSTPTNNSPNVIFSFAFLTRFLDCSPATSPSTAIFFKVPLSSLFSFHSSFFSMNSDANEFFPSSETGARSTAIDEQDLLFTRLRTNHQLATAQSILREWNTATTLSALTREWSTRHENRPIERNGFSLLLYNISSLRMHLEDIFDYISAPYPNIWALTGLHFDDDVNYQLASYFKSRYTIYYQNGSNSFGGVCLAITREVPHRIASEFNDINNLIAADVFNLNKKYTVAVVYFASVGRNPDWYSQSVTSVQSTFNTSWRSECETSQLAWLDQQFVWSSTCRMDRWEAKSSSLQYFSAHVI